MAITGRAMAVIRARIEQVMVVFNGVPFDLGIIAWMVDGDQLVHLSSLLLIFAIFKEIVRD